MTTRGGHSGGSGGGKVYALGVIGAGVYYWQHADADPKSRAKALGKALVWPAFVVYGVLEHLSAESEVPQLSEPLEAAEE